MAVAHTCLNTGLKVVTEGGIPLGNLARMFGRYVAVTDCELLIGGHVYTDDGLLRFIVDSQCSAGYNLSLANICGRNAHNVREAEQYREMVRDVISSWCDELGVPEKIDKLSIKIPPLPID